MRIRVRVTPFRSEIHKPKYGWLHMGKGWLLMVVGVGWESQEMRTQICEAVKCWLLKIRLWCSGGWWRNVGYGGGFDG